MHDDMQDQRREEATAETKEDNYIGKQWKMPGTEDDVEETGNIYGWTVNPKNGEIIKPPPTDEQIASTALSKEYWKVWRKVRGTQLFKMIENLLFFGLVGYNMLLYK